MSGIVSGRRHGASCDSTQKAVFIALLCGLAAVSCQTKPTPSTDRVSSAPAGSSPEKTPTLERTAKTYGAPLQGQPAASLAQVLAAPADFQGKSLVVEGHVRRACSRKGCWMELAPSKDDAGPGCRVTFKDYSFFVPIDSQGSDARVEGVVEVTQVKKSRVDHLEEEGAQFPDKNDDGSANEVRLVATGVELTRS